jgi:inner membrane protein
LTWRTHFLGGVASLWLLPIGVPHQSLALAIAFALLGSLLPDLDARQSKLSNVQIAGITPLKPAAYVLNRRLGHRGVMHSLWALLIVAIALGLPLALLLDPLAGVGLVLGYLSHLLLDACTRSGVPLLWPETSKVHLLPRGLRVVTGSRAEDIVFFLLAFAATGFLLTQLLTAPTIPASPIPNDPISLSLPISMQFPEDFA